MTGLGSVSAYQQISRAINARNMGADRMGGPASGASQTESVKESGALKVEAKGWSPIGANNSLVPKLTEYGNTVGDVKLSDKASDYLDKLKSKFHNMEFITVNKNMKAQAAQHAASYGNASKMVVLIDEEKLERMATDESYRKKYEGIIAMSQSKMDMAKNSLASTGAAVKNFGMSVDSNGKESFFATVEKSQELQKKRIEKKAAEKKEQQAKEKKKAEKEEREERLQRLRDKKSGKTDDEDDEEAKEVDDKEYVTFESKSFDNLLTRVKIHSYDILASKVVSDMERMLGTQVDYKG